MKPTNTQIIPVIKVGVQHQLARCYVVPEQYHSVHLCHMIQELVLVGDLTAQLHQRTDIAQECRMTCFVNLRL